METKSEKKEFRCKGRRPGTTAKCDTLLFRTDGDLVYMDLGGGRELKIRLKRRVDYIECYACGFHNQYY